MHITIDNDNDIIDMSIDNASNTDLHRPPGRELPARLTLLIIAFILMLLILI